MSLEDTFLPLRHAQPADAPLLAAMNLRLIRDEGHRNPMNQDELETRMRGWLESGEYRAVIFTSDGTPAGYALFRESPDGVYLRQFFVERGLRRQGLGRRALARLLTDVFPPGARLSLEVLSTNTAARSFWEAAGFQEYALTLELRIPCSSSERSIPPSPPPAQQNTPA